MIFSSITSLVIVGLLLSMFFFVMMSVFSRYVLSRPFFWTEEMSRYLMFYMVLIASSIAIRENSHPTLLFIVKDFPPKIKKVWLFLVNVLVFIVLLFIFYEGYLMAVDSLIMKTPALRISYFWVYLALPIGSCLMIVQLVLKIIKPSQLGYRVNDLASPVKEDRH